MQHKDCFEAVNRMLQDVRMSDDPFGGVVVVFGGESQVWPALFDMPGDLRQCLPVIPQGSRSAIVNATITNTSFWPTVKSLRLHENMRLSSRNDLSTAQFARWLLDIGEGIHDSPIGLPKDMCLPCGSSEMDLIDTVYPEWSSSSLTNYPVPATNFQERAILATHNEAVNSINDVVLERFPGHMKVYPSADSAVGTSGQPSCLFPPEYLHTLNLAGFPGHNLHLKRGCPIILLRNLNPAAGLCNGTRMLVQDLGERVLGCQILTGPRKGQYEFIPRIKLMATPSPKLPLTLNRVQFPVRLAFAMTINKSQGQSLTRVGLDLRHPVFSHGQLYVALSRSTRPTSVTILLANTNDDHRTRNVVFHEVFQTLNSC